MANNINRLNFNITGYNYIRQEEAAANSAPKQDRKKSERQNKELAASDILKFMAANKTDLVPVKKTSKTVDVNKYVNAEQEERIAQFMKNFEADYEIAAQTAINEFGVSEKTADEIALKFIDASY